MTNRSTVPLTGTHSKVTASLHLPATLALQWAQKTIEAHYGQSLTLSAIARRALVAYADRLAAMKPDDRSSEGRAVARASKALGASPEDAQAAFVALESIPLPPWPDVLYGPNRIDQQALTDKAMAMADDLIRTRRTRKTK